MSTYLSRISFLAVLGVALLAGPAVAQQDDANTEQPDIVDTAVQADDFNTLAQALEAADLVGALKGDGPFTVFAPTDAAFDALPDGQLEALLQPENKGQLQAILQYHVVSGKAMASDVTGMDAAPTLEGRSVQFQVTDGTVTLMGQNTATVVQADIEASNGVIHVIDSVLLPPEAEEEDGGY
ncbi:MAG: fasciclin domain-containing protein [Salinibacter sp.]|jgi:Secreted and surface protein containing fasciclin-like repeats|uniref:fasciclin domain-containing protein n=1 Tax=Salinibacter sp. TaxID=2065818 RepID=UPI002FC3BDC3